MVGIFKIDRFVYSIILLEKREVHCFQSLMRLGGTNKISPMDLLANMERPGWLIN